MPTTLQQQIIEKFLSRLAEAADADFTKIEKLRILLSDNKRAKADDFVKIFATPSDEDLK